MAFTPQEQFDSKIAAPERQLGNIDVNLTNGADSRLAANYSAGSSAEAALNNHFGTPAIFNGEDTIVAGADPTKAPPKGDTSFTAWTSRHVKSVAGNDQYVSATSMNSDADRAQLEANSMLHRGR
jgi:hypothetical protein